MADKDASANQVRQSISGTINYIRYNQYQVIKSIFQMHEESLHVQFSMQQAFEFSCYFTIRILHATNQVQSSMQEIADLEALLEKTRQDCRDAWSDVVRLNKETESLRKPGTTGDYASRLLEKEKALKKIEVLLTIV